MSHIRTRTLSSGQKRYQAKLTDPSGREHVKTFTKRADARTWLRDREAALLRDDLVIPGSVAHQGMTFPELARLWKASWSRLQPKTTHRYQQLLDLWLLPYWGRMLVSAITHQHVQDFVDAVAAGQVRSIQVGLGTRKRPPSPTTVRRVHAALATMLTEAVRRRVLLANPAKHCRLPHAPGHVAVILSLGELQTLYTAFDPADALAVELTATTGLRAGEVWGLQVHDLRGSVLRVERALKDINGHLELGPTKTHSTRDVTLPTAFAARLRAHTVGRRKFAPMFAGPTGARVRHNLWSSRVWRKGVRAAFPPPSYPVAHRHLRFHDLRHTHASLLLAAGYPATAVAQRLGHASVTTTLNIYAHALPGSDAELATLFERTA